MDFSKRNGSSGTTDPSWLNPSPPPKKIEQQDAENIIREACEMVGAKCVGIIPDGSYYIVVFRIYPDTFMASVLLRDSATLDYNLKSVRDSLVRKLRGK